MVSVKTVRRIGSAALIVPSLDHLVPPILTWMFAPAIMETFFGPGAILATIFFLALGAFQLIWIRMLLKSNSSFLLGLGILGNLVSILIYFISISGVTLLGVPPQPFSSFAVLVKALEATFILASAYVLQTKKV